VIGISKNWGNAVISCILRNYLDSSWTGLAAQDNIPMDVRGEKKECVLDAASSDLGRACEMVCPTKAFEFIG